MAKDIELDAVFAVVAASGFACQRLLEFCDPIVFGVVLAIKKWRPELWGLTDKDVKTWVATTFAIAIGVVIGLVLKQPLPYIDEPWSFIVFGLAVSMGSNAVNSLTKYGEYAKEARKLAVVPLPVVTVTPSSPTVAPGSSITLLSTVSGTDSKLVNWEALNGKTGGTITQAGEYTAPLVEGQYLVAARSQANAQAFAIATITVKK